MGPQRIRTMVSQIDLAPTLLSLMGMEADHPMVGRDITRHPEKAGRAMMQFNDNYAWMGGDHQVLVLRPDQSPLKGIYDPGSGKRNTPMPSRRRLNFNGLWHLPNCHYGFIVSKSMIPLT